MQSNYKKISLKALYIFAIAFLFYGCAKPPLPDLIWPDPPDIPRIKFIKSIGGESDLAEPGAFERIILGGEKDTLIKKPWGAAMDSKGRIYLTDTFGGHVLVFDLVNDKIDTIKARGMTKPTGIAIDSSDKTYITDTVADTVYVMDKDGKEIGGLVPPEGNFNNPAGIAVDNALKRVYVVDSKNYSIRVFDTETLAYIKTIGGPGKGNGQFNIPQYVSIAPNGNIVVTDTMNGRIQILDPNGKFIRKFGQLGDIPGMFARPKGNAVDSEGHIYVVDAAFGNVQIFNDEGQVLMAFATSGTGRGQLNLPAGMFIDKDDYIYVVDQLNRKIQMFEFLGEKHKAREEAKKALAQGKTIKKEDQPAKEKPAEVKEEPKKEPVKDATAKPAIEPAKTDTNAPKTAKPAEETKPAADTKPAKKP